MSGKLSQMLWSMVAKTDAQLPDSLSILVLARLCDRANQRSYCWTSQKRLAAELRMSVRSLQNKLDALEEAGLIRRHKRPGSTSVDGYWITLPPQTITTDDEWDEGAGDSSPTRTTCVSRGAGDSPQEPIQEPTKESPPMVPQGDGDLFELNGGAPLKPAKKRSADELFEEWWEAYPRKKAKAAAKRKFKKLLADREVDFETMLAGARRYAEAKRRDPRFICLPQTWLNQGRWDDEEDHGDHYDPADQAADAGLFF